ncbi:MAG: DEAD/DEAH box helicase [Phycisphaerae bacterium]|nr:DEAD/DEAH box helicase [Phycisphaerae bacterium]
MDVASFLARLQADRHYRGQIASVRVLPARAADFRKPTSGLPERLRPWLAEAGIEQLYAHQAEAYDAILAGEDVVIATGTASGKTLCYQLPIIAALLEDREARALYLSPAKALAYDQLGGLERLISASGLTDAVKAACYDGDTPQHKRPAIRRSANILLSNPDMLHVSVLPYHAKWAAFFSRLRYIVLDEIHSYRGIFGSHVAGVLWRLSRLCEHYGSRPQFICCSATLGNPRELAENVTGRQMRVIDQDASPRGAKHVVLWNPPWLEGAQVGRRSANVEAMHLMKRLLEAGAGTITFTKARVVTELIYKFVTDALQRRRPDLAARVRPYRGGYLPNERREIEQGLFSGRILGVCGTNALELGIDVGSLDAAIVVGFPRTFCSLWQQVGRAGRRQDESLAVFVAYDEPIDQYLMRNAQFVFEQPLEHAIVDPRNPHILAAQLRCASFELPLSREELESQGDTAAAVAEALTDEDQLAFSAERYYATAKISPAVEVDLRTISDATYAIVDTTDGRNEVIGQVDSISAPELVYPEAIYLHKAESYIVRELDEDLRTAKVERFEADYYTQPVLADDCRITREREDDETALGRRCFGDVVVQWQTTAFRKFKYYTQELIGQTKLNLGLQRINTTACWIQPPKAALSAVTDAGHKVFEALSGVRNLCMVTLPPLAMCDRFDIGGIVDSAQLGVSTIFMYDRYEGGLGYARYAYDCLEELLHMAHELVAGCACEDGCPGCVAPPNLRVPIHHDPDVSRGYEIPSKAATLALLGAWVGEKKRRSDVAT